MISYDDMMCRMNDLMVETNNLTKQNFSDQKQKKI